MHRIKNLLRPVIFFIVDQFWKLESWLHRIPDTKACAVSDSDLERDQALDPAIQDEPDGFVCSAEELREFVKTCHWADRLAWWLEGRVSGPLFSWAYDGSDQELVDAEDIPAEYRSPRQAAYVASLAAEGGGA